MLAPRVYEEIVTRIFDEISEGMAIVDSRDVIVEHNTSFCEKFHLSQERIVGERLSVLRSRCEPEEFEKVLAALETAGNFYGEITVTDPTGRQSHIWLSAHNIEPLKTGESYRVLLATDITKLMRTHSALRHTANHDPLTSLPNRRAILEKLEEFLGRARRFGKKGAVFFIDLDNFKRINDNLGHKAGDDLLREASARLRSVLRSTDGIGRLGGDEFLLIVEEINSPDNLMIVAQKIIDVLNKPFELNGYKQYIGCSIGIALFPYDADNSEELLQYADLAMYRAKEMGKNCYQFYSRELDETLKKNFQIEKALRDALELDGFYLVFQPQVDLTHNIIVGLEALIRLNPEVVGLDVSPTEFIPVAEETNLILEIGRWVLTHTCQLLYLWKRDGGRGREIPVSINLSRRQLLDEQWVSFVQGTLHKYGIAPSQIEFEITETAYLESTEYGSRVISRLHDLGCKISIDDFGTGYSSLSLLKEFSPDKLKIDKSFIRQITDNPNDRSIVKASIAMAKAMGMEIVAEGVETPDQKKLIQLLGCDDIQGFVFSKPKRAEEIRRML